MDKTLQNKENISPIFNYLAPSTRAPTLNRPVSPPPKPPRKPPTQPSLLSDRVVQTEPFEQKDEEVQTDAVPVPDDLVGAYYDLAVRYDVLRDELNTYKGAHEELQEKYLKNKKVWEAWTKIDEERREQSKKRRRDGSIMLEVGVVSNYTTPATSITAQSPKLRPPPPILSPNKPIFKPSISHLITKKPGLFAGFKGLAEKTRTSSDLGIDIGISASTKDVGTKDATTPDESVHPNSESSGNTSWPSSVLETQAALAVSNPSKVSRNTPKSSPAPNAMEGTDDTADSESSEPRSITTTPTAKSSSRSGLGEKRSQVLPPRLDPVFKVPKIKKEKLDAKRTRPGDSAVRPVIIKSEASATSSEGFGYHLFEQESLDLDDIGCKPDTPRKRQRTSNHSLEELASSRSSGRVGWTNGGFTIKRTPGMEETQNLDKTAIEETQDEDEGLVFNEKFSVLTPSPLAMNYGEFGEIRMDSQLARPKTPPGAASAIPAIISKQKPTITSLKKSAGKMAENKENQNNTNETRISPPPLGGLAQSLSNKPSLSTPVRKGLPTLKEPIHHKRSPQKPRAKRRTTSVGAIANITEDGTDGAEGVGSDDDLLPHPPIILMEEQRKRLEGTTRLSEVLNSPAPKTPSLAHLKKKTNDSKSVPAKKPLGETFDKISASEPPKRKAWVDPMRHTRGKQTKQGPRDPNRLDITNFRVNPDLNEGRDYAFAETVRNREARKCLPGCAKTCCKELAGFVEAAGLPTPAPRGPRWRSSSPPTFVDEGCERKEEALDKEFTAKFGKHRDAFARRRSPPGFWDADFPDTQDIENQNEAAEEIRMQKVEDMRREAEKGGKGRYIYKN